MTDVFVSYARPDEPHAKRVAEALGAKGYEVWRDDQIPAHRLYAEVIDERLKGAKAVVVLWSAEAARSQWVRSEADAARQLGTLVQVTLDRSLPRDDPRGDQDSCRSLNATSLMKRGSSPSASQSASAAIAASMSLKGSISLLA